MTHDPTFAALMRSCITHALAHGLPCRACGCQAAHRGDTTDPGITWCTRCRGLCGTPTVTHQPLDTSDPFGWVIDGTGAVIDDEWVVA